MTENVDHAPLTLASKIKMVAGGIDPGKHGAMCLLLVTKDPKQPLIVDLWKLSEPVDEIWETLRFWDSNSLCLIGVEKQWARPKLDIKSSTSLLVQFGRVVGWLEGVGIPFREIPPANWKKYHGVSTKRDSIEAYQDDLGGHTQYGHEVRLVKHHDLAESALLALYMYDNFMQSLA